MLEEFSPIIDLAEELFPGCNEISRDTYYGAIKKFFKIMKEMPQNEAMFYFFENYHSEDGCAYVIFNDIVYFTVARNASQPNEEHFYGIKRIQIK